MIQQSGTQSQAGPQSGGPSGGLDMAADLAAAGGVPGGPTFAGTYPMGLPMMPGQVPHVRSPWKAIMPVHWQRFYPNLIRRLRRTCSTEEVVDSFTFAVYQCCCNY